MHDTYSVYLFTFPDGKHYVGCTHNVKQRWRASNYTNCSDVGDAVKRFGWQNIKKEVLYEGLTQRDGFNKEIETISFYRSDDPACGYNRTGGGLGSLNTTHTDEWKRANSERMKGRKKSDETLRKLHDAMIGRERPDLIGELNGFYGKQHDAAAKERISDVGKTKVFTAEIRKHMSEGKRGKPHTRRVLCVETGTVYPTIKAASEDLGIFRSCITDVLYGRGKTAGGYHWEIVL